MTNKLLYVVLFLLLFSCVNKESVKYTKLAGFTQGTNYHITYQDKRYRNFDKDIKKIFSDIDAALSVFNPNSIVSRFNKQDNPVEVDEHFRFMFEEAKRLNKKSNGAFDVTVGPLVQAWGFGTDKQPEKIDSLLIDSLLKISGMHHINIADNKVIKKKKGVQLNFNAIAKGYTVDVIADFFDKKKINNYLIEIGGEVRVKGKNPKKMLWRIGVDKPEDGNKIPGSALSAIIRLNNKALATSGNYRNYYVKDGIKFAHTINPETGYPVQHQLLSTTIVTDKCAVADAFATACMVKGLDESIEMVENDRQIEGFFIFNDKNGKFRIYVTNGLKKNITHEN